MQKKETLQDTTLNLLKILINKCLITPQIQN